MVWAPKYLKWAKQEYIRAEADEVSYDVADYHGFEIQELKVAADNGHFFELSSELFAIPGGGYVEEYFCE